MKRLSSVIAFIIVVLMALSLLSGIVISGSSANAAGTVSSMQKELDEIAKKKEALEKELNVISEKKEEELQKKSIIDEQVNSTKSEIGILNNMISELDVQLEDAQEQLSAAEKQVEESIELSKNRIRSAYEQGEVSAIGILLKSKNIYDLISKVEIVSRITQKDNEVIESVKQSKAIIKQKQAEIKENKEESERAASRLKNRQQQLEKKQDASEALIDEINSDEAATKRAVIAAEAAEAELQNEIRAALAAASSSSGSSSGVVDTGNFMWPLASKYHNITSRFGYRTHPVTGVYKLHSGCDIASSGIRGAAIRAAKGGTVMKAGYNSGYGNYVLINHGDGYATLYGHADTLTVSAGQSVQKGEVIGYVGSTGYSTGPHLHFEIIKNGEYTNPLDYFGGVMSFTFS